MKGKKITKKQLKQPDEFITVTQRLFLFVEAHLKKISIAGIIILAVLLAVVIFQMWERRNERDAQIKFNTAEESYQMAMSPYREGSPADYKAALAKFDEVIKEFPRTSSGKVSLLYKGNIHLKLGEYDEAIKAYQAFLGDAGKNKLYQLFTWEGLGYAYEGKKDYEKAVDAYQKTVAVDESFKSGEAYLNLGRCYEKMGKQKEALENYKNFMKVAQKSQMANEVLRKVSLLEK